MHLDPIFLCYFIVPTGHKYVLSFILEENTVNLNSLQGEKMEDKEVDIKAIKMILKQHSDRISLMEVKKLDNGMTDIRYFRIDDIDMWDNKIKIIVKGE